MSIRKQLIKLNNKLESSWSVVDFVSTPVTLEAGWYVSEFMVQGSIDHTPRLVIKDKRSKQLERKLIGFHSGRNRMLIYLPAGQLVAHSESINFERLARVSILEARARILLICGRYLRDFFNLKVLLKMLLMQFQDNFELSSNLLQFYSPARGGDGYLENVNWWQRFQGFGKQLSWFVKGCNIAVIIEHESQRQELDDLLLKADQILMPSEPIPSNIDYVIALKKGDHLRSPAILMLKQAIRRESKRNGIKPKLIYTDHDFQFQKGFPESGLEPVFKPNPSAAYLYCYNYIGFSCVISTELITECEKTITSKNLVDDLTKYHLALSCINENNAILGISEALFTTTRTSAPLTPEPISEESPWPNIKWQRGNGYNHLRANLDWQDQPSVDLVIPTRDGMAVLKPCVDSILSKTTYANYSVIIVDNGSELEETLDYFSQISKDPRVTIVEYPGEFNYSAINNFAVSKGNSEYVALVNNDIEVINGDWLTQMMVWAVQDSVGIVGAKLLFGNGKVQHAGVTIGMGNAAGHIHRLEEGDAPGYQLRCLATQNMMAVTAACLITPRELFEQLGGLDEVAFKVAYNDIDYCLRVESEGHDIIWTPEAVLYHHESVSRGDDMSDEHIERYFKELEVFQSRWKSKGFVDKYYSKHLRISDEGVFPQIEREREDQLKTLI